MHINDLVLSKNAQFYKIDKKITKKSIVHIFQEVSKNKIGRKLIEDVKKEIEFNGSVYFYSLIVFKVLTEPSFLASNNYQDLRHSYLLLIEVDGALVISKKNVESPEKYLEENISEYGYESFSHFLGNTNPDYERIAMRNMSISDSVIRARSLEAKSLNGLISSNSSSSSIARNFRMKSVNDTYIITPSSSRITLRETKVGLHVFCGWANDVLRKLKTQGVRSQVLNNFASPVELGDIVSKNSVTAIFFNFDTLDEMVRENTSATLFKKTSGKSDYEPFSSKDLTTFFNVFNSSVRVFDNRIYVKGVLLDSEVTFTKKLINIKIKLFNQIFIKKDIGEYEKLSDYVKRERPFSAVFDNPSFAYFSRSCFSNDKLINNLDSILHVFDNSKVFGIISSEKEKPHDKNISEFPKGSLFREVEDLFMSENEICICDDMNDEWADHILIDSSSRPPVLTFIHSKFTKKDSYGASKFHEVVAQALKNLVYVSPDLDTFKEKFNNKWFKGYEETKIQRLRKGTGWLEIEKALSILNENPNSQKRVILATPFLEKSKLKEEFDSLRTTGVCKPHYIQLIWLINTFIGSCKDMGIQPYILCK